MSNQKDYKDKLLSLHSSLSFYQTLCEEIFEKYPDADVTDFPFWLLSEEGELKFSSSSFKYTKDNYHVYFNDNEDYNDEAPLNLCIHGHDSISDGDIDITHREEILGEVESRKNKAVLIVKPIMRKILEDPMYKSFLPEFKQAVFKELHELDCSMKANGSLGKSQVIKDLINEFEQTKILT